MKKRSPVEHGGEKREKKRDCIQAEGRSERKGEPEEEKSREEGKSVVLFMPPSALVFTFSPPASCFTSAI